MTDLDSPRRNNDCYFYYYSTCAKGDSCTFRHEPSALGCETMCSFWKEGKCLNVHCNFRHMELRKNRKAIQCYWETQPGGCLKPHCPFLHQNVKQSLANYGDSRIGPNKDSVQTVKPNDTVQASEKNYKSSVDSLVVNFEEESDTESAPSPIKIKKAIVKTLEEIKLERIQEESAAYFSFHESSHPSSACEAENDLRHRLLHKMKRKRLTEETQTAMSKRKKLTFIENASLDDHIKILSAKEKNIPTEKNLIEEHISQKKKLKCGHVSEKEKKDINTIKIKTLAEIRAERLKRRGTVDSQLERKNLDRSICSMESENEVSSTSKDEIESKISHKITPFQLQDSTTFINNTNAENSAITIEKNKNIEHNEISIHSESIEDCGTVIDELRSREVEETVNTLHTEENNESTSRAENTRNSSNMKLFDTPMEVIESENISDNSSNKLAEEVLLLDDDEDYVNVNFKAEDELLDEIDDILGN